MAQLMGLFEGGVGEGPEQGENSQRVTPRRASLIVAGVEGAIMSSNLYKDRRTSSVADTWSA